jgi:hypothetical protein
MKSNELKEVFEAVLSERQYQDRETLKESRPDMIDMNMGDILLAIEENASKARKTWYYDSEPYQETIEYLRKIAALCFKAGEKYGMRERNLY